MFDFLIKGINKVSGLQKKGRVIPLPSKDQVFDCGIIAKPVAAIASPTKNNNSPTYLSATSTHPLPAGVLKHILVFTIANLLTLFLFNKHCLKFIN